MIPNPVKFWGFFSNSLLIRQLPKSIWLNSATFGSIAASQALYDFQVQETVGDLVELNSRDVGPTSICHSEEHHEIYGHYPRTYTQLIDGYQKKSGSLIEAKKLQGKIFKLGFHKDGEITNWLIDIYFSSGDLVSVLLTLDVFPCRNLSFWNKLITGYLSRRSSNHVFQLFSQMLGENVCPDAETFSAVLRAGSASKVAFYCIEQVHAQVVRYGFATNLLVCNPLIDLYSKHGFVDSAKQIFVGMHFRE